MYTVASCSAALRALRSMQQLMGNCAPLPGAAACNMRRTHMRAFSADAAEQLAREEAPGSAEMASRNTRVFSQVGPCGRRPVCVGSEMQRRQMVANTEEGLQKPLLLTAGSHHQ